MIACDPVLFTYYSRFALFKAYLGKITLYFSFYYYTALYTLLKLYLCAWRPA